MFSSIRGWSMLGACALLVPGTVLGSPVWLSVSAVAVVVLAGLAGSVVADTRAPGTPTVLLGWSVPLVATLDPAIVVSLLFRPEVDPTVAYLIGQGLPAVLPVTVWSVFCVAGVVTVLWRRFGPVRTPVEQ